MATITLNQVSFEYDEIFIKIFEDLSLRIDTGWKTGLIGRNGRGKTTLLYLLHNKISPTKGSIEVPLPTAYFPYVPENQNQSTLNVIRDCIAPFNTWEPQMQSLMEKGDEQSLQKAGAITELYEQAGGYDINAQIEKEIAAMQLGEIFLQTEYPKLSGGEQTRALIIALFLRKGQFLLLDEPTNHLDIDGREALANYLAKKTGFLMVSHDRFFLDLCVDHIISINRMNVQLTKGNYSTWKYQFDIEEQAERRSNEKLKKEIAQFEKAATKRRSGADKKEKEKIGGGAAKGHIGRMAAKQMKRALVIERKLHERIENKKELFKNLDKERHLKFGEIAKIPKVLLNIHNVTINLEGRNIIKEFSLSVRKGQRLALIGRNGTGKTTLLKAICKEIPIHSGTISVPGNVTLLRAYQKPKWVSGLLRQHLQTENLDETRFRQILGVMGVSGDVFERPLETFSQGQLKKWICAVRLFRQPISCFGTNRLTT